MSLTGKFGGKRSLGMTSISLSAETQQPEDNTEEEVVPQTYTGSMGFNWGINRIDDNTWPYNITDANGKNVRDFINFSISGYDFATNTNKTSTYQKDMSRFEFDNGINGDLHGMGDGTNDVVYYNYVDAIEGSAVPSNAGWITISFTLPEDSQFEFNMDIFEEDGVTYKAQHQFHRDNYQTILYDNPNQAKAYDPILENTQYLWVPGGQDHFIMERLVNTSKMQAIRIKLNKIPPINGHWVHVVDEWIVPMVILGENVSTAAEETGLIINNISSGEILGFSGDHYQFDSITDYAYDLGEFEFADNFPMGPSTGPSDVNILQTEDYSNFGSYYNINDMTINIDSFGDPIRVLYIAKTVDMYDQSDELIIWESSRISPEGGPFNVNLEPIESAIQSNYELDISEIVSISIQIENFARW